MGHIRGGIHEQVTAHDQTGQSQHDPEEIPAQVRIVLRQLTVVLHLLLRRQQTVLLRGVEGIDHEGAEADEQDDTVGTADLITPEVRRVHIVETEYEEQEGSHRSPGDILLHRRFRDSHRRHYRRTTHDERRVEDVRTDHVTDGQIRRTLQGRHQTDEQLRCRSAGSHDRQTDEDLRHTHTTCQRGGTFCQSVSTPDHQGNTYNNISNVDQHNLVILVFLFSLRHLHHPSRHQRTCRSHPPVRDPRTHPSGDGLSSSDDPYLWPCSRNR